MLEAILLYRARGLYIVLSVLIFFVGPGHVVFEIKNFHRAHFGQISDLKCYETLSCLTREDDGIWWDLLPKSMENRPKSSGMTRSRLRR